MRKYAKFAILVLRMNAKTKTKGAGRPKHTSRREAISILLALGKKPAEVHAATGASLTVIYEVRRALAAMEQPSA